MTIFDDHAAASRKSNDEQAARNLRDTERLRELIREFLDAAQRFAIQPKPIVTYKLDSASTASIRRVIGEGWSVGGTEGNDWILSTDGLFYPGYVGYTGGRNPGMRLSLLTQMKHGRQPNSFWWVLRGEPKRPEDGPYRDLRQIEDGMKCHFSDL